MLLFLRATSQVAMLAWIFGDCRDVYKRQTSCYVGDNTDIIVMTEALKLVKKKLVNVLAELAVSYTHLP